MANPITVDFDLPSVADTEELGRKLASAISHHAVVALLGPLGAGKTTFAKGLAEGLGVEEVVTSPTFTMLNEYSSGRIPLYHYDLYRLREPGDPAKAPSEGALRWLETELDEVSASDGVILIEWANYFQSWIAQQDHVLVELNYSTNEVSTNDDVQSQSALSRKAHLMAFGEHSRNIVERIAIV